MMRSEIGILRGHLNFHLDQSDLMLTKGKKDKLVEIFVEADDFCIMLEDYLADHPDENFVLPKMEGRMGLSEVMTLIVFYQYSGYKCFKYYYQEVVASELIQDFPRQVGYRRFLQLIPRCTVPLYLLAKYRCLDAEATGVLFIDSKKLPVCHNRRIHNHKVFKDIAARGRTSTGWLYGLKLHLVVNNLGQCVNFAITPGNVSDNHPDVLRHILHKQRGKCYGDKGYISRIFEELHLSGLTLITRVRKNMKNKLLLLQERYHLYKRAVIESIFDVLMSVFDLDHTRHRSPRNAMAHWCGSLVAYSFMEQKPGVLLPKLLP